MAITEEEKRILRAFNAGYVLSAYEPKLLEQIIKNNPKNEFVQIMDSARELQEFKRGIPKKQYTTQYKNGFNNARTLRQHDPELLDKLINTKGLNKEYTDGLAAGKKEYQIQQSQQRMRQEREQQQQRERSIDRDMDFGMEY